MKTKIPDAVLAAEVSRRGLVKTTAIGGLAMASSALTLPFSRIAHAVDSAIPTKSDEKVIWSACTVNCGSRCPLRMHVVDGEIKYVETDNTGDDNYDGLHQVRACLRGRSMRRRVYNPDRLKYPMKRVGKRGEGKFERITWDEALDTIAASLKDVDVTMMLFEPAGELTDSELTMIKALQKGGPAIAVINKVDLLDNFAALEARKKQVEEFGCFDHIVTISAKDGTGCDDLFALLKPYGNEGPHYFDDDAFTDMPEKELVAELVREKALLFMREEIPHGIAVVVERFKERPDKDLIDIDVDIYCERKSHKGMIIGKGGQMLKKIASAARMDIEELLGVKVNLQCWVKVREDWRDNEQLLNSLGFAKP